MVYNDSGLRREGSAWRVYQRNSKNVSGISDWSYTKEMLLYQAERPKIPSMGRTRDFSKDEIYNQEDAEDS